MARKFIILLVLAGFISSCSEGWYSDKHRHQNNKPLPHKQPGGHH